jgi:hypothetical protein
VFEPVAQLVEHRTFNAVVPGSSPGRLTTQIVHSVPDIGFLGFHHLLSPVTALSVRRVLLAFSRQRIRRGTFRCGRDLIKAINNYIRIHGNNPRPFQGVASASRIVRKVSKYKNSETAD